MQCNSFLLDFRAVTATLVKTPNKLKKYSNTAKHVMYGTKMGLIIIVLHLFQVTSHPKQHRVPTLHFKLWS